MYIGLEGLLKFPFKYRGQSVLDANTISSSGWYYAMSGSSNTGGMMGFLLHFDGDGNQSLQILADAFGTGIFIRAQKFTGGSFIWGDYIKLG